MDKDRVDLILEQWRRERPDLDTSTMGVIGRIYRVSTLLGQSHTEVFARFGLDRGEFDVLATLRRSGAPFRLSPTQLFRSLMMSSGGMTNRLDRLERAGLARRVPDPRDRRSVQVELTDHGLKTVDEAVAAHVENQHRLLASMPAADRDAVAALLRRLLLALEGGPEDEGG
ncbi:MAG TPA: MarR family transcriptional regulator [Longimicrobium sp.]|nr:MarR family transcriptional regulator [Longimicrobium sp.]